MPRSEVRAGVRGSIAILLVLVLASACSFNYEGANASAGAELPDAVFHDFDHNVYMAGMKVLSLHAGLAESYDKDGRMVLHDVDFSSYSRGSGALAAEGHAESAVFHSETQDAEFSGSITIHSTQEDASLKAEYLEWKGSEKTLSGGIDRSVTVTRGDGSWLRGAGFVADSRRRSFSFRESVEGAFVSPEGESAGGATAGAVQPEGGAKGGGNAAEGGGQ